MPLTRRRLLAVALLAGADGLLSPPGPLRANEDAPARLGLGFSLYGLKPLPTIPDALRLCREIGYDCVELPVMTGWPGDSAKLSAGQRTEIRDALTATNLRLSALMENLIALADDRVHRDNLRRLQAAGELGRELSPNRPPVIETVLGSQPTEWEHVKPRLAERLREWAAVGERTKTVIAIKAHVGGAAHLPEHAVWLAEQVASPWLKCVYDYSHFELRGVDLSASIKTLVPHSVFIHVKDSRGTAGQFQFLLPGDGRTDYGQLLKLAVAAGYRGDVLVEVSGQLHSRADYQPAEAARRCYAHLAQAFERAGVARG